MSKCIWQKKRVKFSTSLFSVPSRTTTKSLLSLSRLPPSHTYTRAHMCTHAHIAFPPVVTMPQLEGSSRAQEGAREERAWWDPLQASNQGPQIARVVSCAKLEEGAPLGRQFRDECPFLRTDDPAHQGTQFGRGSRSGTPGPACPLAEQWPCLQVPDIFHLCPFPSMTIVTALSQATILPSPGFQPPCPSHQCPCLSSAPPSPLLIAARLFS